MKNFRNPGAFYLDVNAVTKQETVIARRNDEAIPSQAINLLLVQGIASCLALTITIIRHDEFCKASPTKTSRLINLLLLQQIDLKKAA
jgi:hypothetical protein